MFWFIVNVIFAVLNLSCYLFMSNHPPLNLVVGIINIFAADLAYKSR